MIYVNPNLNLSKNIHSVIHLSEDEIAVKVQDVEINMTYRSNLYQPIIYNVSKPTKDYKKTDLFVPLIEQYYHNFLEIFPRILLLKKNKQNFRIVLVSKEGKENGIFFSLIKNHKHAKSNTTHVKDFLDYFKIDYVCMTPSELILYNTKYTYVFYHRTDGVDFEISNNFIGDTFFKYDDKNYKITNLLPPLTKNVLLQNVEIMQNIFPNKTKNKLNKIYISRKKSFNRAYEEEEKIEFLLQSIGYKIIYLEDMHLFNQINEIRSASHIVCLFGSSLVNALLCQKSTKIFSIKTVRNFECPTYAFIFDRMNIEYKEIEVFNNNSAEYILNKIKEWENAQ
jgi:hypothetical protein